jgi:hypothetical protein
LVFRQAFIQNPRDVHAAIDLHHFPITMRELNELVKERISDHPRMTAELPIVEPQLSKRGPRHGN